MQYAKSSSQRLQNTYSMAQHFSTQTFSVKSYVSLLTPVCPSDSMEQLGTYSTDFH
jgi:hypothetical protein